MTLVALLCVFVAVTLPGTLVSCSPPREGYAEGFTAWRVFMILSSIVATPLLLVAALIASCIRTTIQIPGKILLVLMPASIIAIALFAWLAAPHVQHPNCFP